MIGRLKGVVDALGEDELILDVGGVGYLISTGSRTRSRLEQGASTTLEIETYVREDQFRLFGFLSESERAWFVRLQSVQGVGAKHALSILDAIGHAEVESASALGDASTFERAKGVGKKLAQRIATELKDKAPPLGRHIGAGVAGLVAATQSSEPVTKSETDNAGREGAVSALLNLGYSEGDARRAVAGVLRADSDGLGEGELIRLALKELAR